MNSIRNLVARQLQIGIVLGALIEVSAIDVSLPVPTRPTGFPLRRPITGGEVVAWGTNDFGQISIPTAATNIVSVCAGVGTSLALRADGVVFGWGDTNNPATKVPAGLADVVGISLGNRHALALKADGTAIGWGENNNATVQSGMVAVSAGYDYSLGLRLDGSVVTWGGFNRYGQQTIPSNATNIVSICAGVLTTDLIRADGVLIRFGDSSVYEGPNCIGSASTGPCSSRQVLVLRNDATVVDGAAGLWTLPSDLKAVALSISDLYNLAITPEHTVRFWTTYNYPQADGMTNVPPRLRNVVAIAAGHSHALVVRTPSDPIPTTAIASPIIVNGFIVGLNVVDPGEGYKVAPQVTISGGGGSGAIATAEIVNGAVTRFNMMKAGVGYTSTPTIAIEAPPSIPHMSIASSRVNVTMQVIAGRKYQLLSTDDYPAFAPIGLPFTADSDTIVKEFTLSDTGRFFEIEEVP